MVEQDGPNLNDQVSGIIDKSDLTDLQKRQLLNQLEPVTISFQRALDDALDELGDPVNLNRDVLSAFADSVFRRILGMSIEDLTPLQAWEIDHLAGDALREKDLF